MIVSRPLPRAATATTRCSEIAPVAKAPLAESRRTVLELAALFCLDAAAGGFTVTSLLVLWLHLRFGPVDRGHRRRCSSSWACSRRARSCSPDRCPGASASSARWCSPTCRRTCSSSSPRSRRSAGLAIACLMVPCAVPVDGRAGASGVRHGGGHTGGAGGGGECHQRAAQPGVGRDPTPRRGGCSKQTTFGWPLVIAGLGKATYDLLLLARFGRRAHATAELGRR